MTHRPLPSRPAAPLSCDRYRFDPFEVSLETGELWREGVRLRLQPQPFAVLAALISTPGRVVSRERLRQHLWPEGTFVDYERGLNAAVKRLRTTLGDSAGDPRYIETLPRRGYRFLAPVEATDGRTRPPVADVLKRVLSQVMPLMSRMR